jgi:hypothetical protein
MFDKSWGQLYPLDFNDPALGRTHVDHCIETLRLSLMCYGDVTPVMLQYNRATGARQTDFNTHHKCRNFDKISEYLEANGADVAEP